MAELDRDGQAHSLTRSQYMTVQPAVDKSVVLRLGTILTVGLLLRCLMLSHQSFWLDEMASWMFASGTLPQVLHAELTNPPLYYLLLHFWMNLFGSSEAAIRALSVVPSLISVWLVFRLGGLLFSRPVALLAAFYFAISTFQIYYAQEARCFSLLVCLLLIDALCFWKAINDIGDYRLFYWSGVTIFGALSLYTHFISIFFLAGFGLYVLFRRPKQLLAGATSIALALLIFAPFLVRMLTAAGGGGQVRRYLLLKLPQAYFSFLFGDSLIPLDEEAVQHIPATLKANWWILALSIGGLAILLPFFRSAWKRWGEGIGFAFTMAVGPVLLAFLVSFKVMLFDERYLIPASPFLYMMVSAAFVEVLTARQTRSGMLSYAGAAAGAIYGALLAISLANYYFNPRFGKEEWREADAYIDHLVPVSSSGVVVFDPDYVEPCYRYYSKRNLPEWRMTYEQHEQLAQSTESMKTHTDGYEHVVLVRSHVETSTLLNAMMRTMTEESYRKFPLANGIEVYSFRPN